MPGRKKTPVAKLFKDVPSDGKVANVKCLFCSTVMSKNGSRMVNHIEKCKKCGDKIKKKYLTHDKGQKTVPTDAETTEERSQGIDSDSDMELQLLLHDTSATSTSTHTMQRTLDDSFFTSPIPMPSPRPDTATGTTSRPGPGSSVSVSSGITPVTSTPATILQLPPSSASVERSFSRHALVHSARRNRLTTDRAAKLVFIGQNLALGNVDDAHEYPHHAAHATNPPPPQPSTSRDSTASSNIPTFQLDVRLESSDDSDHSETEDSEGSIDDPPSPGPRVMISSSDIKEPEEERQEPQDLE